VAEIDEDGDEQGFLLGSVCKEIYSALQGPCKEVKEGRIAVFLDRDGTLNEEVNFVRSPEQFTMLPGAADAVGTLNRHGIIVCIISNQSGVARGFFTEEDLVPIHRKLEGELGRSGARIDRIYYCPHHPTEGKPPYNVACSCRKPGIGMLQQAAREFGLDLQRSFVVGDRIVDIQAGRAAGATSMLVLTGYGPHALEECREQGVSPDYIVRDIAEAAGIIIQKTKGETPEND
jgi:D-glycero-D-manno-heptose 1,7-bisphosphate phosphatase